MPGSEVLVGDITDATVKEKVVSLSRKKCVNMIVGGPPCQGYSMKGKKLGLDDPRNFLFREYLDLVEKLQFGQSCHLQLFFCSFYLVLYNSPNMISFIIYDFYSFPNHIIPLIFI